MSEPLDFKIWDEKHNNKLLLIMIAAPILALLIPIFIPIYFGSFLLRLVLWVVYSVIIWVVLALTFGGGSRKEEYEKYLKDFYENQKVEDTKQAARHAERAKQLNEEKEAQLLKELYALRHTEGDNQSLDAKLAELEKELDQERKITELEAALNAERAMREKYKDIALKRDKNLH